MIQRFIAADPRLDAVVDQIVARVHPVRVILFGSRARGSAGPESDYDLLVEIDALDTEACWCDIRAALGNNGERVAVDVVVRTTAEFEQRRQDVGYLDWDIAREGVVLYPPGGALPTIPAPVPPPRRVREAPPPSAREWLARAAQDLRAIETNLLAPPVPWMSVSFHSQQGAEKYLKALLACAGTRPAHTHDLVELVAALRTAGRDLGELTRECRILDRYAVAVRYPEAVPIPDETAGRAALMAARRIVGAVLVHLASFGLNHELPASFRA